MRLASCSLCTSETTYDRVFRVRIRVLSKAPAQLRRSRSLKSAKLLPGRPQTCVATCQSGRLRLHQMRCRCPSISNVLTWHDRVQLCKDTACVRSCVRQRFLDVRQRVCGILRQRSHRPRGCLRQMHHRIRKCGPQSVSMCQTKAKHLRGVYCATPDSPMWCCCEPLCAISGTPAWLLPHERRHKCGRTLTWTLTHCHRVSDQALCPSGPAA